MKQSPFEMFVLAFHEMVDYRRQSLRLRPHPSLVYCALSNMTTVVWPSDLAVKVLETALLQFTDAFARLLNRFGMLFRPPRLRSNFASTGNWRYQTIAAP